MTNEEMKELKSQIKKELMEEFNTIDCERRLATEPVYGKHYCEAREKYFGYIGLVREELAPCNGYRVWENLRSIIVKTFRVASIKGIERADDEKVGQFISEISEIILKYAKNPQEEAE